MLPEGKDGGLYGLATPVSGTVNSQVQSYKELHDTLNTLADKDVGWGKYGWNVVTAERMH